MTNSDVFAALASPVRREILNLLLAGPQPVNNIAAHFELRRPSVSEHLKVLRDAGLVGEQRDGRQRFYRLRARPLEDVRDWLNPYEQFWPSPSPVLTCSTPRRSRSGSRPTPAPAARARPKAPGPSISELTASMISHVGGFLGSSVGCG